VRFLADESCDFAVVRAMRAAGHEVVAVAETEPGALDEAVINRAALERLILLTEDKDFGQLEFAGAGTSAGVILIRFPATARRSLADAVLELVKRKGEQLHGRFIVIEPGRVRISRQAGE